MSETMEQCKQPPLPETYYVGRGELVEWLGKWGFTAYEVQTLIKAGSIPVHRINGFKKKFKYVPREVVIRLRLGGEG